MGDYSEPTPQTDAELGARASRLVASMLAQAAKYLTGDFGEINDVLYQAGRRGWLKES